MSITPARTTKRLKEGRETVHDPTATAAAGQEKAKRFPVTRWGLCEAC